MSCPQAHSDAAYVLGALGPAERSAYEAHLTQCQECAAAVAQLAPVPGLLGRVDPATLRLSLSSPPGVGAGAVASVVAHPPRTGRLARLLAAVASQRRRQVWVRRWQLAGAAVAAAALAAAGSAVGFGLLEEQPPQRPPAAEMAQVAAVAPVTAEVAMAPAAGGTEVWMTCWYPTDYDGPAHTFRLVAVGADGDTEQLGSWQAGPGDDVTLTGLTRFTEELVRIELRSAAGATLLAYEVP